MRAKNTNQLILCLIGVLTLALSAVAKEEIPETTPEGLVLMKDTKARVVYARPGATLDGYTKVALLDCYVAFKKNWERDYNRDASSLSGRVDAKDMERIKTLLADEFRKVFTEELQEEGGYPIVDVAGEDVLVVRPAILNLDVTAPDIDTASRNRQFVTSAGEMTLYMELFDSATGEIIARVIDPQAADRGGFATMANSVTNKAEADRIIRKWAVALRSHLGDLDKAITTEESATN
ncbi:MAG TPA: DUF3313 family protein [Woeseiaceae bacterium]|nr:DUF3313 family protein [Woeseiaceae bacterium]